MSAPVDGFEVRALTATDAEAMAARLADLEAATGLNRRQLYNTIGDKRQMFLQAMDEFTEMSVQLLLAPLERDEAGLADIETLFSDVFLNRRVATICFCCDE